VSTPGPLTDADEELHHQVVDTFARAATSDRAWTEKVWASAAAVDGSLSLSFGLGKYVNRNVIDGFGGVSRGTDQWTVRASRRLTPRVEDSSVGPVRYEIVEPLRRVRISLEENEVQPISFEVELTGLVPPGLEAREVHTSRSRLRTDADVLRFHQSCVASGWVSVEGERTEIHPEAWFGGRDRSWGVRYGVGRPDDDIEPTPDVPGMAGLALWMPASMVSTDGSLFGLFTYHQRYAGHGWESRNVQGAIELADGRVEPMRDVVPELRFDSVNRRLLGGVLRCTFADGREHPIEVTPRGEVGFHLGTGLYFGFDGHWQGEWRGKRHVEGEHLEGCDTVEVARRIHQLRDCPVQLHDPITGATGHGICQTIVAGAHPELGLDEESSFT
jgi:hypothetical protein